MTTPMLLIKKSKWQQEGAHLSFFYQLLGNLAKASLGVTESHVVA